MYVRYNKNVIGLRLKLVRKVAEIDAMMGDRERENGCEKCDRRASV